MIAHRSLMTIYFRSRGICAQLVLQMLENQKKPNSRFFFNRVAQYIKSRVIRSNLLLIYVFYLDSTTQKPYDHLFQELELLCAYYAANAGKHKTPNYGFFINCVPKYVIRWVILVYLSIIYETNHNGITQRPHDPLFQKSGHLCNKCSKKLEKPRKIRIYFS